MNAAGDSNDRPADDSAKANTAAEALTPGELLRREREKRSIAQLHIAEELHLDLRAVQAIEANRFDELGVPVYARGHLRQYATLLGLSPQFIIERYEALTGQHGVTVSPIPASTSGGMPVAMERPSLAGPLWMGVAMIALTLGWWIWSTVSEPGDPLAALQEQSVEGAPVDDSTAVEPSAQSAVLDAPAPIPGATESAPASTSTSAAAAVQMRLQFNEASWTEIYDANGKRLMFGMGESGAARTISGTPPLQVTLGKASAVTVQVNDRPVVVPRRAGKDAAKFVVAAGGTVQMSGEVPVE